MAFFLQLSGKGTGGGPVKATKTKRIVEGLATGHVLEKHTMCLYKLWQISWFLRCLLASLFAWLLVCWLVGCIYCRILLVFAVVHECFVCFCFLLLFLVLFLLFVFMFFRFFVFCFLFFGSFAFVVILLALSCLTECRLWVCVVCHACARECFVCFCFSFLVFLCFHFLFFVLLFYFIYFALLAS